MVRKLLKRKLKLLSLKKLKTWSHRKSSLGHWATKQLLKKQNNTFLIRYPKKGMPKVMDASLHHKQLLSAMVSGSVFLHSVNQEWKSGNQSQLKARTNEKLTPELGKTCSTPRSPHTPETLTSTKTNVLHKVDLSKPGERLNTNESMTSNNPVVVFGEGMPMHPNVFTHTDRPFTLAWPYFKLNPQTLLVNSKNAQMPLSLVRTHWKNIYSLDQLMCHQFYAQFRRGQSAHKAKLIELHKCTALYGKLLQRQKCKIIALAKKSHTPLNYDNIPLLMESRLDLAVQQCFVFKTITSAHHWISQGKITVNLRVIKSPSHLLKPGDCIAISQPHKMEYKTQLRTLFNHLPRERKYVQSGNLMSRWNRWATLYNNLRSKHKLCLQTLEIHKKNIMPESLRETKLGVFTKKSFSSTQPWPDRGIANFWYATGRFPLRCLESPKTLRAPKKVAGRGIRSWLARHRWPRKTLRGGRIFHWKPWKSIYRRRIFVFSQWLLNQNVLINDGLYYCRWKKAFIRKKSDWIKKKYKQLSLQKPLHFEVSYKNLCAFFLYPPQKLVLPTAIDFKKL